MPYMMMTPPMMTSQPHAHQMMSPVMPQQMFNPFMYSAAMMPHFYPMPMMMPSNSQSKQAVTVEPDFGDTDTSSTSDRGALYPLSISCR